MNTTPDSIHPPGVPGPPGEGEEIDLTVWRECKGCGELVYVPQLDLEVCYACGHHGRMRGIDRLLALVDTDSFVEFDTGLAAQDPMEFVDTMPYPERLARAREKTGILDGFRAGEATIEGRCVQIGTFEFAFLGGSMGSVVGEKVTLLFERALAARQPAIVISASGGARMQEGLLSLMQMAKSCAALSRLKDEGVPYISVLTHPTTGGVAASFAMLGDVILAEPGALIGFAGPRVIKQTIGQDLPAGFQRSEFLLEKGFLDRIVSRSEIKSTLATLLGFFMGDRKENA
ncbi:acetyl-CoA carboxylase, carboxyltransferase subunit beta [bacterium]|nr:acetyl-CoA carboxylase, carboxyltransferase subunit beta [bacterium]